MRRGVVKILSIIVATLLLMGRAQAGIVYTNLYEFAGGSVKNGAYPFGGLIQGTNGLLYGTTFEGGSNLLTGYGVVFDATTNYSTFLSNKAVLTVLHSFSTNDGAEPYAGVTFATNGNLYGVTAFYALSNSLFPSGMGSVFEISGSNFTRLYRFGTVQSPQGQPLDGASPRAPLISGPGGLLYGTTYNGGTNGYANAGLGYGTIFEMTTGGSLTELHSFTGNDGANPTALAAGSDSNLYGVATYGGSNTTVVDTNGDVGFGTIYRCASGGAVTTLYSFGTVTNAKGKPLDGAAPNSLVQTSNGIFYGTTAFGGSNTAVVNSAGDVGYGTIFQITTNGTFTSLYSFGATTNFAGVALDGANPVGPLVQGPDGNFYGVTESGGTSNLGTIFRITPGGAFTPLYSFETGILNPFEHIGTGNTPRAGLALGADGHLYGTTSKGGAQFGTGEGTLFQLGPLAPTILNFPANIAAIAGGTNVLAAAVDSLYAATYQWQFNNNSLSDGGQFSGSVTAALTITGVSPTNAGTYKLVVSNVLGTTSPSGTLTVVPAQFNLQPQSGVVPAGATNTFTAVVTSYLPASYQWRFNGANLSDGGDISGSVTTNLTITGAALTNSGIYSLVVSNSAGTIQSTAASLTVEPFITLNVPSSLTILAGATAEFLVSVDSLEAVSYQWQLGGMNLSDGGNISGSATSILTITNAVVGNSGTYSVTVSNAAGSTNLTAFLTVISPTAPGVSVSNFHSFTSTGADGGRPNGLLLGPDGAFYGTTQFGGTNGGDGTFFKFTIDGTLTTIYSFTGSTNDEADPFGPLVEDSNGVFYGTTTSALNNQYGTVFAATTNGTLNTLATFYYTNGGYPNGVTFGTDGNLYGTAFSGGGGWGTVFSLDTNTTILATLDVFAGGPVGYYPNAPLTLGSDGNFYGSTYSSSSTDQAGGALFQVSPLGTLNTLYTFTNANFGSSPTGALLQTSDGTFYGTTTAGGANGDGTVFKFSTNSGLTTLYSFGAVTNWDGSALDGSDPVASLALGPDGNLYGSTYSGGYSNYGTVFNITTNGALTTLVWFDGSIGANPSGLALGPDGNFYGNTAYGGADNFGTIFRVIIPPAPPQLGIVALGGNLVVSVSAPAYTNQTWILQSSSNLMSWQDVATNVSDGSGALQFTNAMSGSGPTEFFRVRSP